MKTVQPKTFLAATENRCSLPAGRDAFPPSTKNLQDLMSSFYRGEFSGLKNIRRNTLHAGNIKVSIKHVYRKKLIRSASFNSRAQVAATQVDTRKAALTVDAQLFFFHSAFRVQGKVKAATAAHARVPT